MIIPPSRLDDDTLDRILEDFITREGTDYGEIELSLAEKCQRLRPQVLEGDVLIIFDSATEALQLVNARDYSEYNGVRQPTPTL